MRAYVVKEDTCDAYRGCYEGTEIVGYYLNREKAEAVAATIKKGITTYRDGYIEEIEIEE
jgi:hypothetical protein